MTQKQAILKKLMGSRIVASWRLAEYCLQYNARIFELRKLGFDIRPIKMYDGTDGYKLYTPHDEIDFKGCKLKPKQGKLP